MRCILCDNTLIVSLNRVNNRNVLVLKVCWVFLYSQENKSMEHHEVILYILSLKGQKMFLFTNRVVISTPGPLQSCGPQLLKPGLEYLISGTVYKKHLYTQTFSNHRSEKIISTCMLRW
jgi:hypothetical protein